MVKMVKVQHTKINRSIKKHWKALYKLMNNVACGKTSENLKLIKMDVKTKPHVIKNIWLWFSRNA